MKDPMRAPHTRWLEETVDAVVVVVRVTIFDEQNERY